MSSGNVNDNHLFGLHFLMQYLDTSFFLLPLMLVAGSTFFIVCIMQTSFLFCTMCATIVYPIGLYTNIYV